jgi:hypothetical protein
MRPRWIQIRAGPLAEMGKGEDDGGGSRSRRYARMGEARAGPLAEMARDGRGAWRHLEAMGSGGGVVALGRRMKMMDGEKKTRRYIFGGSSVPGEATDRDYRTFSPRLW